MEAKRLGARFAPSVTYLFGIDTLLRMIKSFNKGHIGDYMFEWLHKYGPIQKFEFLNEYTVVTVEPEHIKSVLASDFDSFEKGELFNWCFQSVLGTGVFNSDGVLWKFHRSITRPFFSRDRITDFDLFNHHADIVVNKLKERAAEQEPVDFQDLISRFTLDSATQFLFGSCVNSLSANIPYAWNSSKTNSIHSAHTSDTFAEAFNQAQNVLALRTRLGDLWPVYEFFGDKTKGAVKVIHSYIEPILRDALSRKNLNMEENKDTMPETLLDHLIQITDDLKLIRDEMLNIMIAGRDTTTATLTFLVYCLSQHPEVLAKLRQEILEVVGPSERPTYQNIKDCRYLRAVINETLRLYPAVPFNIRYAKRATTLPAIDGIGKPYYVPKGAGIGYSVFVMHRRPDLWGPDAHLFDPERFLDQRVQKYLTPNPFIFLPFNAGPRICLGQQFAYNEMSLMIVRLLQAFDKIEFAPQAQPHDARPPANWDAQVVPGREREKLEKI